MNGRMNYEKNNAITSLKNEIYGLSQLISELETLKTLDYSTIDGKILNVKVERFFKERLQGYVALTYNELTKKYCISLTVKERYNTDTKSYIQFYADRKIDIDTDIIISDAGKQQTRFNAFKTLEIIDKELIHLKNEYEKLSNEFENIDSIVDGYIGLHEQIKNFKSGKSGFFLDCFKSLKGFY